MAALPRPSGTAVDNDSAGPLPRKSNGADGARSKNGMHLRRKYNLLASEEPEGGRANAGSRARGDGHGATRETVEEGRTETPTEAKNGQRSLLARDMHEDGSEDQIPPDRL